MKNIFKFIGMFFGIVFGFYISIWVDNYVDKNDLDGIELMGAALCMLLLPVVWICFEIVLIIIMSVGIGYYYG